MQCCFAGRGSENKLRPRCGRSSNDIHRNRSCPSNYVGALHATILPTPLALSSSIIVSDVSFEPVLDVGAASAFSVIAILFVFLITKANAVETATTKRKSAMEKLRVARTKELTGGESAEVALKILEDALKEEENLRTIIPGIRIRAPNSLQEEDKEQIRILLKFNETSQEKLSPIIASYLEPTVDVDPSSAGRSNVGISNGSKFVLGAIMISQLFLLYILSFDPMKESTSNFL